MVMPGLGNGQRPPRRKSSFLSLRKGRSKDKLTESETHNVEHSPISTFIDALLGPPSNPQSRMYKLKGRERQRRATTSSAITDSHQTDPLQKCPTDSMLTFTSLDLVEPVHNVTLSHGSRDAPESKRSNQSHSHLRSSSSFETQAEAHLQRPIDGSSSGSSLSLPYPLVSAPVAGVEFMDALVDGMNGVNPEPRPSPTVTNRSQFAIPGHHPLYQPPLPTPPPGIVLGGAKERHSGSSNSEGEDEKKYSRNTSNARTNKRRNHHPSTPRSPSNDTPSHSRPSSGRAPSGPPSSQPFPSQVSSPIMHRGISPVSTNVDVNPPKSSPVPLSPRPSQKTVVPSISEIIRNHAPLPAQHHSRPSTSSSRPSSPRTPARIQSISHSTLVDDHESEPEPLNSEEEAELLSRSSIDSIADEVQRTLRNQGASPHLRINAPPIAHRESIGSDTFSTGSARSELAPEPSIYSDTASTRQPSSPMDFTSLWAAAQTSQSQPIAQYLRSARLTTILKLTRSPHASIGNPLTVSLSDLGARSGYPVVVFLGLGCVRHIMGLYDEMAEILGIRLITIDRWGLGRTESRPKSCRGIMEWGSVVEEILDMLQIRQCSIMAHSAGAPYALSFANKARDRIKGGICLLAPWVGGGESNYKWLKYVPNGILKTAQAAEWKVQAWMLGKPPRLAYEGIGYIASPRSPKDISPVSKHKSPLLSTNTLTVYPSSDRRPSIGSSSFSEYDDLRDFEGRFESCSTLGVLHPDNGSSVRKRKLPRGFLRRRKGVKSAQSPTDDKVSASTAGRGLKALRSVGSLRSKASASAATKGSNDPVPQLPPTLSLDCNLELDDVPPRTSVSDPTPTFTKFTSNHDYYSTLPKCKDYVKRPSSRRSASYTAPASSPRSSTSTPSSPVPSTFTSSYTPSLYGSGQQAALGNALIAASHAESANGTHSDLLQILNRENHSWGFSYSSYPHNVYVWYGDRDEKIAENGIRWMEKTMGEEQCQVKVVKGADHGLMYKSSVVVEVLEHIRECWP